MKQHEIPLTEELGTLERKTGVEVVREALRAAILRGEFGQDGKLILTSIAAKLGTSVTPVREAIRVLANEGLVDIDLYKGAKVHTPRREELVEVYSLRKMLESRAVVEVAVLPDKIRLPTCDKAEKICQQMAGITDVATWTALNRDYHAVLVEPLRGVWPRLCAMIEGLRNISLLPVAAALRKDSKILQRADQEHLELIVSLRERDKKRAANIIGSHLDRTLAVLTGGEYVP